MSGSSVDKMKKAFIVYQRTLCRFYNNSAPLISLVFGGQKCFSDRKWVKTLSAHKKEYIESMTTVYTTSYIRIYYSDFNTLLESLITVCIPQHISLLHDALILLHECLTTMYSTTIYYMLYSTVYYMRIWLRCIPHNAGVLRNIKELNWIHLNRAVDS